MVVVLGASGVLGKFVCRLLYQSGIEFFAVTRNKTKLNGIPYVNNVVQADISDLKSLNNVINSNTIVVNCVHSLMGNGSNNSKNIDFLATEKLIEFCAKIRINYFIQLSVLRPASYHNEVAFLNYKINAENKLKNSGLNYAIIQAAAFMQMHIAELMGKSIMQKGKANIIGNGILKAYFVDAENIAQLIVKLVQQKPKNVLIQAAATNPVSRIEIVKLFEHKLNKSIKINKLPSGLATFLSIVTRPFNSGISNVMKFAAYMSINEIDNYNSDWLKNYNILEVTVSEFVAKYEVC